MGELDHSLVSYRKQEAKFQDFLKRKKEAESTVAAARAL
jgi:hypothetical protein